jgi:hypothetical protein
MAPAASGSAKQVSRSGSTILTFVFLLGPPASIRNSKYSMILSLQSRSFMFIIVMIINSEGACGFIRLCRTFDELLSSKAGENNEKKIKSFSGGCFRMLINRCNRRRRNPRRKTR